MRFLNVETHIQPPGCFRSFCAHLSRTLVGLRRAEPGVKCAALNLVASAVEGMGDCDRDAVAVQLEALKIAASCAKDRHNDAPVKCEA